MVIIKDMNTNTLSISRNYSHNIINHLHNICNVLHAFFLHKKQNNNAEQTSKHNRFYRKVF